MMVAYEHDASVQVFAVTFEGVVEITQKVLSAYVLAPELSKLRASEKVSARKPLPSK
jgi:hypothetical protein